MSLLRVFGLAAGVLTASAVALACAGTGTEASPSAASSDGGIVADASSSDASIGDESASQTPTPAEVSAADQPIDGLSASEVSLFNQGDALFDVTVREPDGLGPFYVRTSCGACHEGAARGPGLVQKMAIVEADGVTTSPDQSLLPFGHTIREGLAAGATTPILAPVDPRVKVTIRVGPPVFGRGYMEAVLDSEILRVAAEQALRTDGIHGTINRVTYASQPNPDATFGTHQMGDSNLVGRFGLKARLVSLDEFTADALQGDMGMTNPLRPTELVNPDGLTDDAHPGIDLDANQVNLIAGYLRRLAIPVRVGLTDQAPARALFDQAKCSVCHAPSLKTRSDYPIAVLAGVDAPIFTDMLVHDMGSALADGLTEGTAPSSSWRTAPLIGLRFCKTFLHDGRVTTVDAAIRAHDGEGQSAAAAYAALSTTDRDALLHYIQAL